MTRRKKASNGAGTLERRGLLWWVIASLPRKAGEKPKRKAVPIAGSENMTEAQARREGAKIARDVKAGKIVFDEIKATTATTAGPKMTVRQIGEALTSGQLFKDHGAVNGLKRMSGGDIMGDTLGKRVYPVKTRGENGPAFGDLDPRDVKHTDIAKIMAAQSLILTRKGKPPSAGTRNHVHNYLSRIFSLAEIPLGVRDIGTNPVLDAYRAAADEGKRFNFLYPPEVLALLANEKIPIGRRVQYLVANYFGWRKGTLGAFMWSGIDWADGTVSVLWQKGYQRLDAADDEENAEQGTPIFFVAPTDVLAVLRAWHEHCGSPAADSPVIRGVFEEGDGWREGHDEKQALHADLHDSGVERELLFSKATNVEAIRFHDCRATFCTWARRAGKDDGWIRDRTGHKPGSNMVDRYARDARTLADLNFEPFPDATRAIPELADAAEKIAARLQTRLPSSLSGAPGASSPPVDSRFSLPSLPSTASDRVEVLAP